MPFLFFYFDAVPPVSVSVSSRPLQAAEREKRALLAAETRGMGVRMLNSREEKKSASLVVEKGEKNEGRENDIERSRQKDQNPFFFFFLQTRDPRKEGAAPPAAAFLSSTKKQSRKSISRRKRI